MPRQSDPLLTSVKSKFKRKQVSAPVVAADIAAFTKTIVDRIEMVPLTDLKAHPRRTRTHDEKQITIMTGSFNEFGFVNPLLVDEKNVVLAGDARWEVARRLGIKALPVVRIGHLSEAEKRAFKIADNRTQVLRLAFPRPTRL